MTNGDVQLTHAREDTLARPVTTGASFRFPVIVAYATDNDPNYAGFDLGLGLGCPNQLLPQHGPAAARQLYALVKYGRPPSDPAHSQLWRRTFGALPRHRALTFDHRSVGCGSNGEQS